MDWKKSFRKDIKNKLVLMRNEYNQYKKTNNVGYLQQASGKLFSIVENFLQVKYSYRVKNYVELKALVRSNKNDYDILIASAQLHYFYYNGEVQMPRDEAEYKYNKLYKRIMSRITR